ncbi:MAG: 5'-3' exonuclease H3TH domain-containing protein [Fimbriimonadaceae bacterium]
MRPPLLIVDGDNLTHRAYHTSPKSIVAPDGTPVNAIVGFFSILAKLWATEPPSAVFVAWDTLGMDTYRSKLLPAYQTGRIFEPSIVTQLNMLPEICRSFGFGVGKQAGFEADDIMATAALQSSESVLLYTTDKDSYQLVDERINVLAPQRGGKPPTHIGPAQVVEILGVLPEQVADFKALAGDPSDKIPGAKGIGPKTAASLLLQHGSLEEVLKTWSRPDEVELLRMYKEIVLMRPSAIIELPDEKPDWRAGAEVLRTLGANNLATRVSELS